MVNLADEQALLRGIIEKPDDDALRLIAADWYEEAGQQRVADFIRWQMSADRNCCHATLRIRMKSSPFREEIWQQGCDGDGFSREEQMAIASRLLRDTPALDGDWFIRRGFIDEVRCCYLDWYEHGKEIVQKHPIQHVYISDVIRFSPNSLSEEDDKYYHWYKRLGWSGMDGVIPEHLFNALPQDDGSLFGQRQFLPGQHEVTYREYTSLQWANSALSAAAIYWARGGQP